MKTRLLIAMLAMLVAVGALAADAVQPASCTFTNFRGEAESYLSSEYFYEGTTLRFTNCVVYSGSDTNSAIQGLDAVTVTVDVGTTATNISYAGTVQVATSGTWWADVLVPEDLSTVYVQVKLTDANTNIYIYPWKLGKTKDAL